jgi:hypothetical protein
MSKETALGSLFYSHCGLLYLKSSLADSLIRICLWENMFGWLEEFLGQQYCQATSWSISGIAPATAPHNKIASFALFI